MVGPVNANKVFCFTVQYILPPFTVAASLVAFDEQAILEKF